jgi:hypothetical protein
MFSVGNADAQKSRCERRQKTSARALIPGECMKGSIQWLGSKGKLTGKEQSK